MCEFMLSCAYAHPHMALHCASVSHSTAKILFRFSMRMLLHLQSLQKLTWVVGLQKYHHQCLNHAASHFRIIQQLWSIIHLLQNHQWCRSRHVLLAVLGFLRIILWHQGLEADLLYTIWPEHHIPEFVHLLASRLLRYENLSVWNCDLNFDYLHFPPHFPGYWNIQWCFHWTVIFISECIGEQQILWI